MNEIQELENKLTTPSDALIKEIAAIKGDIMILGVGGKMGPTLAKLLKRAIDQAGLQKTRTKNQQPTLGSILILKSSLGPRVGSVCMFS